jgi:metal-responsive CopG/Arc/MetJ family transcriptional regulator
MKTAISIPDRVFRSAEELAARLSVSRSELYSNALAEFIEKHKNDLTTSRLNEVYAKNREPSTLEPEIALLQYHTAKRKT